MNGSSSLISRFAASTAALAAAIVLLAFFAFHAIRGDIFDDSFESPLDEWSTYVAGRIGGDPEIARAVARNHEIGVMLTTPDGVFAFGPDGTDVSEAYLDEEHEHVRTIIVHGHDETRYSFYLSDDQGSGLSSSLLWSLLGGLLFLLGVVYVVQLSQLRPLRWLREGVEKVSAGDLSTRVPVVRMDEVGQVGRAFNDMTERLEQMLNDHDRLMADVSHELRSPLARIKLALEMLPAGDKRDQIATDVREMEALTATLLERERVKNRTGRPEYDECNLGELVHEVKAGFADRSPDIVLVDVPEALSLQADAALIKVLLHNLLDNAVKFSADGSDAVEVHITEDGSSVNIRVDDSGIGIPLAMCERVLEPFVKLDPSRGHRVGYGLGLNLCQRIVEAHKGAIQIAPREPHGTTVLVELPLRS